MNVLLLSVEIIDPYSPFHRKKKNVFISNGTIKNIAPPTLINKESYKATKIIDAKELKLSPGWFDMRTSLRDPGFEHKEDITSGCLAAAYGGFTEITCLPNTNPVIQTKNVVAYIKNKCADNLVEVYPIAAVSVDINGLEMTDMIDLHHAGAVAFSDGEKPIWHTDILLKSLQYLQLFKGVLYNHAEDTSLTQFGCMNEGKMSTMLGMKGMPKIAEELMITRDLKLLEYVNTDHTPLNKRDLTGQADKNTNLKSTLHFSHISVSESVNLIRKAKAKGLNVTCDIAAHQIAFDDTALSTFDTNFKVNPPFRNKEDIKALWKGLADGTIDAIVSDHNPQDEESKKLEFDLAEFGIIGLETAFSVINTYNSTMKLEKLIEKFTCNPRKILGVEMPKIEQGQPANLTLFDPDKEWIFTEEKIKSKSKNSPFIGKKLKGKVIAVFNKGKVIIN